MIAATLLLSRPMQTNHICSAAYPPYLSRRDRKKLPFFLYSYIDSDIVVGRGRGGGLAVWMRADKVRDFIVNNKNHCRPTHPLCVHAPDGPPDTNNKFCDARCRTGRPRPACCRCTSDDGWACDGGGCGSDVKTFQGC